MNYEVRFTNEDGDSFALTCVTRADAEFAAHIGEESGYEVDIVAIADEQP